MRLFTITICALLLCSFTATKFIDHKAGYFKSAKGELNYESINDTSKEDFRGSKTWYYRKNGSIYRICKDGDGLRVRLPNGNHHSYGTGWKIKDVKRAHGIGNVRPYRSSRSSSDCN